MNKDILVIGTGISGLTFAIKVAEENPKTTLTLISKSDIKEGNTRYAQGGIAVVRNLKKDSTEKHLQDTLVAGDGACDPKVVKFVVEEANQRLDELINWGTAFDKKEKILDLGIEGGHSERRIVHYKDQTGKQIQEVLSAKVKSFSNITILENHTLVDLITDHHSTIKKKPLLWGLCNFSRTRRNYQNHCKNYCPFYWWRRKSLCTHYKPYRSHWRWFRSCLSC